MRTSVKVAVGFCAWAGAACHSATASAEYFHRYDNGSWSNAEYNDGTCHYYYSHNSYDGQTHVNRYGDCSRVAIGPGGRPVVVMSAPAAVVRY